VQAQSDQVPVLNEQLRRWENTYDCVRPHQSLAYLTPLQNRLIRIAERPWGQYVMHGERGAGTTVNQRREQERPRQQMSKDL
jgi:hypothetical protein